MRLFTTKAKPQSAEWMNDSQRNVTNKAEKRKGFWFIATLRGRCVLVVNGFANGVSCCYVDYGFQCKLYGNEHEIASNSLLPTRSHSDGTQLKIVKYFVF